MKPDLSIIIPFAGEYPQVLFTVQSIAESLINKLDFEIIVINNDCKELRDQWKHARNRVADNLRGKFKRGDITEEDILEVIRPLTCMTGLNDKGITKSADALKASAGGNPWLKYMEFSEYLSHWECKRLACLEAKADTFLFVDAHCIISTNLADMWSTYLDGYDNIGSFHMPLTYKILEWRRLVYKMVVERGFYGYSFTGFPGVNDAGHDPVEVPCMSTCGMMISRRIYERVGGWPANFGAYGGGENFMNYALSVTGHSKFIYPAITCHHHGEGRDYHSTYDGTLWNRLVAHYLFGGAEALHDLRRNSKGRPIVLDEMEGGILANTEYKKHRAIIKRNTTVSLKDWVKDWEEE